ncbi:MULTISPECIES: hypothetical protein [unclassified Blastococcus]
MTVTAPPALVATRDSWHHLGEHVLAAGQFAAAGTIRLRPHPGGFSTTVGVDGRQLAVVGNQLVVLRGDVVRSRTVTTLGAAAAFAGVALGLRGSYPPATDPDPAAPLPIDVTAARQLAGWYALGEAALRRFAAELGAPAEPVLWPEHLDLAISLDAVDYGVSPGDEAVPRPYLYVAPHDGFPAGEPFWNAPFGAARAADRVGAPGEAVDFFHHGRELTGRSRT